MRSSLRPSSKYAASLAACAALLSAAEWRPHAAGTITGVVFEDFNGNGVRDTTATLLNDGGIGTTPRAVDRGVAGVQVQVFDGVGLLRGAAVTGATGAYSLAATGTGPYRVEFTGLPDGYAPSAAAAGPTGNGTTVQFVADGATADVNLGILNPDNFCRDNPTLVTSCFVFGDQASGPYATDPVVLDVPYSAGSSTTDYNERDSFFQPATHALMVRASAVGSVFGLGYRRATHTIYAAAYMKKHSGFGPRGTGAIYAIDPSTGTSSLFADLNAIFGAGTAGADPHAGNGGNYGRDNDNTGWDAVGKSSLGGLEVSPDGATIYVINLADRRLYALPASGPLTAATVRRVAIPVNVPGATGGGADVRPFALQWHRGRLYVGLVNSAESTQQASDLRGYVYAVDPATLAFGSSPALQFALNYPRGAAQRSQPGGNAAWRPWRPTFATASPSPEALGLYPQPMLSGLTFDANGNLVIGVRDRAGDQFGNGGLDAPGDATIYSGIPAGDTLVAAINTPGNPASGWTFESNAQAGALGPTAGAGSNQGPGGGEYFFADHFENADDETSFGAVLAVPGFPDVLTTAISPGFTVNTGGFLWMRMADGAKRKGYDLYLAEPFSARTPTTFPHPPPTSVAANGLGEVVALCTAAPIEIGNRVWADVDGDGVQDPQEPGLDGVLVQLVAPNGVTVLGTATTANGGQYYFSSAPSGGVLNGVYGLAGLTANTSGFQLRINLTQSSLGGRELTTPNADGSANGDSRDSDGVATGLNAVVTFATGGPGYNTHTYDFGFRTGPPPPPLLVSLGNLVWADYNNDGRVSAGEPGIPGVTVRLFDATGTTLKATQVTSAAGLYRFDQLQPGDYVVEVVTPVGFISSTGNGSEPAPDPDNDVDNDDNGTAGGTVVRSLPVTLAVGTEPVNDGDTDANSNLTVDFGFYEPNGDPCLYQTVPTVARPGGTIPVTYTLVNRGPGPALDSAIIGDINQYTTVESASPSAGGVCSQTPGWLTCVWAGATPPGVHRSVDVVFRVSPTAPHGAVIPLWFLTNRASTYSGACTAVDTYVFVVDGRGPVTDLALTASLTSGTHRGQAVATPVGAPLEARFVVTNNGTLPGRGQYSLLLDRANGVQVTSAAPSQGWVQITGLTSAVFDTGDIPPGKTATLVVGLIQRSTTVVRLQAIRVDGRPADPDATNDHATLVMDGIGASDSRAVAIGNVDGVAGGELITGGGRGDTPQVRVFSGRGTELRSPFYPFPRRFYGGLSMAACDVDGNGVDELVVAQASGGGQVRVLSLAAEAITQVAAFYAFEPAFTGGVNVACANVAGDARAEVVVAPAGGRAPDVRVYGIAAGAASQLAQFSAYEASFTGGVRVAASSFAGSPAVGGFQIATMPGPGRSGDVRVWRLAGSSASLVTEARLLQASDGASLTLGDANGDGTLDLLVAPDSGSPRLLQMFSLGTAAVFLEVPAGYGGVPAVRTAVGPLTGGPGVPEVAVAQARGGLPVVGIFSVTSAGTAYQRLTVSAIEEP